MHKTHCMYSPELLGLLACPDHSASPISIEVVGLVGVLELVHLLERVCVISLLALRLLVSLYVAIKGHQLTKAFNI